jgi:hypothetical protein
MLSYGNRENNMSKREGMAKAKIWLDKQIKKYGNTCYFPAEVKAQLNKKLALYGNTYFWR